MFFTSTAKNLMLDALDESISAGMKFASLHTAYSATGTNEVTGGSPAYARKAATWSAASSGSKAMAATLPTWDVPASTTVAWIGFWDAVTAGNFLGMLPNGGGTLQPFASSDDTNDLLYREAHGYSAGDAVVVYGANLPTGLTQGTIYYVVSPTTDSFSVSATSGGSAVNISDEGEGHVQKIVLEGFGSQGTHTVASLSIDLSAVA